eukprot:GFUD01017293.1.p1 GENE.GFUD01017293.1~~GFUD01017293.1.p1  ORF type:complete len:178 (+),score=36.00 GFUD01017293.1:57-590(+)
MGWVGGIVLSLLGLAVLGSGETEETNSEGGFFKEPGRRKLRDPFTPKGFCTGSITLRDAKGKVYVVKATELNVNFKPDSVELIGSCCYYLYQHSTKQAGDYQLVTEEGPVKPHLGFVGSVFKTPCQVQSGSVLMTVFLVIGILLMAIILGFVISKMRTKRQHKMLKAEEDDNFPDAV